MAVPKASWRHVLILGIVAALLFFGHEALIGQEGGENIVFREDVAYGMWYRPPLSGLWRIVRSGSGTIFIQHLASNNRVRVSRLNVDKDRLTEVLTLKKGEEGQLIGGPNGGFFMAVGIEIRRYRPNGNFTVWGSAGQGYPLFYTESGRMLGMGSAEGTVVEMFPDGSTHQLASGFDFIYDIVGDAAGNVYISDLSAGTITRVDASGTIKVIAVVNPDNPDLGLDDSGNLYVNNVGNGFVRVDIATGELVPVSTEEDHSGLVKTPADFVFDNSGRIIFATWTNASLSWFDPIMQSGGVLQHMPWTNTDVAIGPDDAPYLAVPGFGAAIPSRVVRFTSKGKPKTYIEVDSRIMDISFDNRGGLYISTSDSMRQRLLYYPTKNAVPNEIPVPLGHNLLSITVDPVTDHVWAFAGLNPANARRAKILEFSLSAGLLQTYMVQMPKKIVGLSIRAAPDGRLYATAAEEKRFTSGPRVNRWILRLDLDTGKSEIIMKKDRIGCCPAMSLSMDFEGNIWWILNPDFLLYRIIPGEGAALYASNLPVDSGAFVRNRAGEMFLNSPEGIYLVREKSYQERIQGVIYEIEEMVKAGFLTPSQGRSLKAKLKVAIKRLNGGKINIAINKLKFFIVQLDELVAAGVLSGEEANILREPIIEVLADLQADTVSSNNNTLYQTAGLK